MKQDSRSAKPVALDETMSRGWQALREEVIDGWVVRVSAGVTKRANSVLPLAAPADLEATLAAVERLYASAGLPVVFQISPDSLPHDLDGLLAERGYRYDSPTLVHFLPLDQSNNVSLAQRDARIEFLDAPSKSWLEVFWGVEGPENPVQQRISHEILTGTPAIYASLAVGDQVVSVARLALVGETGGLYSVATRAESRSRGYGRAVVQAVLHEATRRNLTGVWLQVVQANLVARTLYESMGFESVSRYHYRVGPAARP